MTNDQATRASAVRLASLDDLACEAPALAGNKAATLAVLRREGFQVPPGVVVPAGAFDAAAKELPAAVRAALQDVSALVGPGPWAVRSSGTAEDSEEASFAGQFETVLGVDASGLAEAVLRCWLSGATKRVKTYAGDRGPGSLAVLIQPMIPAEAAGVAFTTDPVTGRHGTVIEAVEGLGERLVSGAATPERWTVEEDGSVEAPSEGTVLDADRARAIADLARRVEAHLGRPQDIEWAIGGGSLWLLQARPITTLPSTGPELIPISIEVPPGYWERDNFHEPVPTSPFGRVLPYEQILKAFPAAFAEFGILIDRAEVAFIGGWIYPQMIPVGAPPPGRGPRKPPPRWLLRILMRVHPAIRRRVRAAREAIASDLPAAVIRRWFEEWRPAHQQEIARARAVDLRSLSDEDLAAQLDRRIEVLGHPAHVMVAIAYWILLYELAEVCRELLGWDTTKTLTLLEGLSTVSTEPARRLADLAQLARSKPSVRELLAEVDETTPGRLAEVDPEFARAFSDYVEATGHRSLQYEVIEPTLAERPSVLLRLVADQFEVEFSPDRAAQEALGRRTQATEEARRVLASHPEPDRERFERALGRAREAYPALEDRAWWTNSVQLALLRYVALEIGRRLVDRDQLAAVEDVFLLEAQDARSALFDRADRRETARVAKRQRAWAIAHPPPYAYGDPPPGGPPFDLLPSPARLVNQGVLWGLNHLVGGRPRAEEERGPGVSGTPASPGRYTGPARVVMGEHEFDKVRRGDVVVCPMTSPAWSTVFPSVGALVTDTGGILSHPAIIAREHGIPAVVGTGSATSVLRDGETVTVDGTTGVVEIGDEAMTSTLLSAGPEVIPIPVDVPPGYWERDNFHEPVPISPFGRVLLYEQILKVFPTLFAEFGILLDRAETAFIGGWMYRQMIPAGAPPPGRGPQKPPPRWLLAILMRVHPAIRRRIRAARQAIASDLPATVIRRWSEEWRPDHQQEIAQALGVDLGGLSNEELAAQLDHRIEVIGHPAHAVVGMAYWILVYELAEACRELLGWDTAKTLTLLEGLSTISTEPARQLAHLAELARSNPATRELLARVDETTPRRLADVDPEFARAFSGYVEANGHRSLRYDVIEPSLAETPHVLLRLVADQLEVEFSPDRAAREALRRRSQAAQEARGLLASRPEADRERFELALARAREAYPAFEDRVWWTFSVQAALLRYVALEFGRRLVDRGQVAAVDDVFFLEAPDARSALFDGADRRETARVAKGQRAWAMANPGPYAYGDPLPGQPPFDLLPPPARLVNQGVLWGLAQLFGEPPRVQEERVAGTPASPGRYTGTVRVVMAEDQFDKIRGGDVVVCPVTSPAWSVVFPSMGALVTDGGGILSHPAIIAREHGIPAVVGTGNATNILKDGQTVTVDGTTGVVETG